MNTPISEADTVERLSRNIMNTIFVHDAHMYIYMKFVKMSLES